MYAHEPKKVEVGSWAYAYGPKFSKLGEWEQLVTTWKNKAKEELDEDVKTGVITAMAPPDAFDLECTSPGWVLADERGDRPVS